MHKLVLLELQKETCKIPTLCSLRVNSSLFHLKASCDIKASARHKSSFFLKVRNRSTYFKALVKGTYTHIITSPMWERPPCLPAASCTSDHTNSSAVHSGIKCQPLNNKRMWWTRHFTFPHHNFSAARIGGQTQEDALSRQDTSKGQVQLIIAYRCLQPKDLNCKE